MAVNPVVGWETRPHTVECPEPGCVAKLESCDLYCPTHEVLLVSNRKRRWVIANILRAGTAAAFLASAHWDTSVPLFIALVIFGVGWLALPLRRSPAAMRIAVAGWIGLSGAAYAMGHAEWTPYGRRLAATLIVALATGYWLWRLWMKLRSHEEALAAMNDDCEGPIAPLAGSFLIAPLLGGAAWLFGEAWDDRLLTVSPAVQRWLLALSMGALLGTLLLTAVAAAVRSKHKIERDVAGPLSRPAPAQQRRTTGPSRPTLRENGRAIDRILYAFDLAVWRAERLRRSRVDAAINFLYRLSHTAILACVRMGNSVHRVAVLSGRRFRATLMHAVALYAAAGRFCGRFAHDFGRSSLLPAGSLVVSVVAATVTANATTDYLVRGTLIEAPVAFAGFITVVVGIWLAWAWLLPDRFSIAWESGTRTLSIAGPSLYLLFVSGCWAIGLPGLLGVGPIKVGPVTLITTMGLVVAVIVARRRRGDPVPEAAPDGLHLEHVAPA